jgi:glucose/arabinose dehydrogenase
VAAVTATTLALGAVVAAAPIAQAAPALPSGFVLLDTPSGHSSGDLTDVAYLPDGGALTTGRLGSVRWVPPGGQPVEIATIPVYSGGSLGLTGIAVAPDYATSRTVYTTQAVSASATNRVFRLSKWRTIGTGAPTGLTEESVILEFPVNADHKGIQDVAVDPGGSILWIAIGDNANDLPPTGATKDNVDKYALRALDPTQPTGKILRIFTNGRGVEDNPFYDSTARDSWRSRTYLSGVRDPRITLDQRGGAIVTDTGAVTHGEVNLAFPGQNLKWPCFESTTPTAGYRDLPECANVANSAPLTDLDVAGSQNLIGGVAYTGTSYPETYRGTLFFANKTTHTLSTSATRLQLSPRRTVTSCSPTRRRPPCGD